MTGRPISEPASAAHLRSTHNPTLADTAYHLSAALRHTQPLIHCQTNTVTENFTANVLIAMGAAPAMIGHPREVEPFVTVASALHINLGTLTCEQAESMAASTARAAQISTPWVLDPVGISPALPARQELAVALLKNRPSAIRGNASEIIALAKAAQLRAENYLPDGGANPAAPSSTSRSADSARGVDTADSVEDAIASATALACATGAVVAVSGPRDYLTDGDDAIECANGSDMLTQITGGGCALGAVMAAFLATQENPDPVEPATTVNPTNLERVAAAAACYALAAEFAVEVHGRRPGSFMIGFLDELARPLDPARRERLALTRLTPPRRAR